MPRTLISGLLILCSLVVKGQDIQNIVLHYYRDSLLIDYDIDYPDAETWEVQLFSSHDNFKAPLQYLRGDVGPGIKSGTGKLAIWDITKEFSDFNGPLAVEIRARFMVLPLNISSVPVKNKKGKPLEVSWEGGRPSTGYTFQLYRKGIKIDEREVIGIRSLKYEETGSLKPGMYEVKVNSLDPIGGTSMLEFRITRRIPLGLQLSPGYGLLGLSLYLVTKPPPPEALPFPPDPGMIGN